MGHRLCCLTVRRRCRAAVLALSFAVAAAVGVSAAQAAGPLQVTGADANGLVVSVAGLEPRWSTDGTGRDVLHVEGFSPAAAPGAALVPTAGAWILVPPGTRPVLEVLAETWRDAGGRPLAVAPVPVSRMTDDGPVADEIVVLPGQAVPAGWQVTPAVGEALAKAGRGSAGPAATLGEPGWWRGRRVVSLTVAAVRTDAGAAARATLAGGSWRVRFVPDKAQTAPEGAMGRRLGAANDERFAPLFLNPGLLTQAPTEAAWRGVAPARAADGADKAEAMDLLAPEIKLAVRSTRLFRVPASRLRSRGLLPDTPIQESEIRLYQRRYDPDLDDGSGRPWQDVEVPIRMVGEGDLFDDDDYFVFYGLRLRDDSGFVTAGGDTIPGCGDEGEWANDFNVYWLAAATPPAGGWARMETGALGAAAGEPLANYRRTDHIEEQQFLRVNPVNNTVDRLYQNFATDASVSVDIANQWAPDPAGGNARIEVAAAVFTYLNPRTVRFDLVVDNTATTPLGLVTLNQPTDRIFGYEVTASTLAGTAAKVNMTSTATPVPMLFSYLNWVRVSYDALYQAVRGEQKFHTGDAAGPRPIEVAGFDDADIGLVEITDPRRPVWIELSGANVRDEGGSFTLSIEPEQQAADAPRRFWAASDFGGTGVAEFSYYDAVAVPEQTDPTELAGAAPDLVVVTHGDFRAGAERWIEHRRARAGGDLDVHVVDVDDLYNWYGGGLRSEWAVRRLVRHAIAAWGSWSLVIVGDANENQRELNVQTAARGWSTDFVPTHYHVQNALVGEYELMAVDKWYACGETGETVQDDDFPDRIRTPWEMLVGRLPCNSADELERMIDKIITVESPGEPGAWRSHAVFFADDAFSDGYGAESQAVLEYNAGELQFAWSERDTLAAWWQDGTPVTLDQDLLLLDDWLAPLYPGLGDRDPGDVRGDTEDIATPPLLAALSQGGLVAHYQGHANAYVLSSEYWFADRLYQRRDVASIGNTGKPWVFFGMGCHISDRAQCSIKTRTTYYEASIGEKLLVGTAAGASASYGSSGYEYIFQNRVYGERMFRIWMKRPPAAAAHGGGARSRWMLGELMWATEAEHLAINYPNSLDREMVAQYTLLGDPLMMLDAGPPEVTAVLEGPGGDQEVSGTVELTAGDASNARIVRIAARDEAGIDRLRVTDSSGSDITDAVAVMADSLPPGQADHQEVHYRLQVPVRPFPHTIDVEVWDTGAPLVDDRHWTLTLEVEQAVAFTAGGEPVDPATFRFETDVSVDFTAELSGAAWLHEGTTWSLASDNLELSNVVLPALKSNTASFSFTATAAGGTDGERSVELTVDGYPSTWVLQAADQPLPAGDITRVYSFPNPMADRTRFLFETGAALGEGVVRVFSVAGRVVASIPFAFDGGGAGVVDWDARDDEGDELANGTYLYRVEMQTPGGTVTSPVQRLVVMR